MKQYLLLMLCYTSNNSGMIPHSNIYPPAYGKTHFIVGKTPTMSNSTSPRPAESICNAYFSPHDDMRSTFIDFINQEKEHISIAIYMFTDADISNAIIAAHKRGVDIEIITDPTCLRESSHRISVLSDAGISVMIYNASAHTKRFGSIMHHKFAIFKKNKNNGPLLWTGSFNFTRAACCSNQENAIIIDNIRLIDKYRDQFEQLKHLSYRYSPSRNEA